MKQQAYPQISVITPSYNQGKFIKETIESVVTQNYPNLEYIVIDGGSHDDTVDILKSYGRKIKWITEKDTGQTNALNKGIKMAQGEIIAYLNSDDIYLPNTLMTVAEQFMANPDIDWLSGNYFIIDAKGNKIQSYVALYKTLLRKKPQFNTLSIANYINQPATFLRKRVIDKFGLFDESLRYVMDYEYWMRIFNQTQLKVSDRHFALFRIHQNSKGGSQYQQQFAEEHQVVKKYNRNPLVRTLHKLHALGIVLVYKMIK